LRYIGQMQIHQVSHRTRKPECLRLAARDTKTAQAVQQIPAVLASIAP
jgi:hypothetical protein